MIKKLMTVDLKKNHQKKPKSNIRHKRAATRDLTDIKAAMQFSDRGVGTKHCDLKLNPETSKKIYKPCSDDFTAESTKENIRKARIRYFNSTKNP
jgi:hypothetical protein